jgi:hypothetical protein
MLRTIDKVILLRKARSSTSADTEVELPLTSARKCAYFKIEQTYLRNISY